jgi:hypothetical protein
MGKGLPHPFDRDSGNYKRRKQFEKECASSANDQITKGTTLLRSPRTLEEIDMFGSFGVQRTLKGVYFTTLDPLPLPLEPFLFSSKPLVKLSKSQVILERLRLIKRNYPS